MHDCIVSIRLRRLLDITALPHCICGSGSLNHHHDVAVPHLKHMLHAVQIDDIDFEVMRFWPEASPSDGILFMAALASWNPFVVSGVEYYGFDMHMLAACFDL
jgi:hypothetical protein